VRSQLIERSPGLREIAWRKDAGAGPGRFLAEVALFHDLDSDSLASEEIRSGQADHAAAENQYIDTVGHTVVIFLCGQPRRAV
jgi:hypothetical protein